MKLFVAEVVPSKHSWSYRYDAVQRITKADLVVEPATTDADDQTEYIGKSARLGRRDGRKEKRNMHTWASAGHPILGKPRMEEDGWPKEVNRPGHFGALDRWKVQQGPRPITGEHLHLRKP